MTNITRRTFILQSIVLLAAPMAITTTKVWASHAEELRKTSPPEAIQECKTVYLEWLKQGNIHPEFYLENKLNTHLFSKEKLSHITKSDFINNKFFVVNGLQLGKTEAAFLALIGST